MADNQDGYFFTRGGKRIFVPYKKSSDGAGGTHEPTAAERERLREHGVSREEKKMTPAEKIASVHIDFNKDNILPELNETELGKIGSKINKPVMVKKTIIDRNGIYHRDAMMDTDKIIGETLYNPSEIFPGKSEKRYFTFVKPLRVSMRNGKDECGVVLLDVTDSNTNFEVVHWHWINIDNVSSIKPKKKD